MRRLVTLAAAATAALAFTGCGDTAQEACVKAFGPGVTASPVGDDEAYCMKPGSPRPVGEVEDGGMGYELDD